jgi:hypothetical protein
MLYDVIIIGGGISGLYSAIQIKKMSLKTSILILEKNSTIGGRMGMYDFYGTMVNEGAGVGRKAKDKILIDLLDELKIKYTEYINRIKYSDEINDKIHIDISQTIKLLKRGDTKKKTTFKKFAIDILGLVKYNDFVTKIGFSDFEKEDVNDVLENYGLDDNIDGWDALKIDWSLLVKKMSQKIGLNNIKLKSLVNSFSKQDNGFIINTNSKKYFTKKLIIATTIETIKRLLPNHVIYNQIHGQTFLRIYAKFTSIIPNLDCCTIVTGPLKKIIPINVKDGIYMIAYTDNKDAISLKEYTKNNAYNRQYLGELVAHALGLSSLTIIGIKSFYWEIGTHYYDPLPHTYKNRLEFINKAQNPEDNILVVGEMIAKHQGWSAGALESVKNGLNI